jgi:hypothetical protein
VKRGFLLVGLVAAVGVAIMLAGAEKSFEVDGSFILWDEYPGKVEGDLCTGERSLYYGINASTEVTVETVTGDRLAAAPLGKGRIASGAELVDLAGLAGQRSTQDEIDAELAQIPLVPCLFMFHFIVETDGNSAQEYVVHLGSWGALTMSEANLRKPGSVQLSVGLR